MERVEITIMRTLRKLEDIELRCVNHCGLLKEISHIPDTLKKSYLEKKISSTALKSELIRRNKELGISKGKSFEKLNADDLEWLRYTTRDRHISLEE